MIQHLAKKWHCARFFLQFVRCARLPKLLDYVMPFATTTPSAFLLHSGKITRFSRICFVPLSESITSDSFFFSQLKNELMYYNQLTCIWKEMVKFFFFARKLTYYAGAIEIPTYLIFNLMQRILGVQFVKSVNFGIEVSLQSIVVDFSYDFLCFEQ